MSFADLGFVQSFSEICNLYQSLNEDSHKHKHKHEPNVVFSKSYVFAFRKNLG